MSNTMNCTAKHPYTTPQWFGRKTGQVDWLPIEDVWTPVTQYTISRVDNISTITWVEAAIDSSDTGQVFCRWGNPLYTVATGAVTHTPGTGDGSTYIDSNAASLAVGELYFELDPTEVVISAATTRNIYVADADHNGSEGNTGLTEGSPKLLLSSATALANSGDTVLIQNESVFTNDEAYQDDGMNILICDKDGVTYDGASWGAGTRAVIRRKSGWSYFGEDVDGNPIPGLGGDALIPISGSDVTLVGIEVDCLLEEPPKHEWCYGIWIGENTQSDIANTTLRDIEVHSLGWDGELTEWLANDSERAKPYYYGIHISSKATNVDTLISNTLIENCYLHDMHHEGYAFYAAWGAQYQGNITDGVMVRNCIAERCNTGVLIANHTRNVTLDLCTMISNPYHGLYIRRSPIGEDTFNGGPYGWVISNCLFANNGVVALSQTNGNRSDTFTTGKIFNNLFINDGYGASAGGQGFVLHIAPYGTEELPGGYAPGSKIEIYNNTIYREGLAVAYPTVALFGYGDPMESFPEIVFHNNTIYSAEICITDKYTLLWDNPQNHTNNIYYRIGDASQDHGLYGGIENDLYPTATTWNRTELQTEWEASGLGHDPSAATEWTGGTLPTAFTGVLDDTLTLNSNYFKNLVTSLSVNAGADLSSILPGASDIYTAGTASPVTRPLDGGWDIGAHERDPAAPERPSFTQGLTDQDVDEQTPVEWTVVVTGAPTLVWETETTPGGGIDTADFNAVFGPGNAEFSTVTTPNDKLVINGQDATDQRAIRCTATNTEGSAVTDGSVRFQAIGLPNLYQNPELAGFETLPSTGYDTESFVCYNWTSTEGVKSQTESTLFPGTQALTIVNPTAKQGPTVAQQGSVWAPGGVLTGERYRLEATVTSIVRDSITEDWMWSISFYLFTSNWTQISNNSDKNAPPVGAGPTLLFQEIEILADGTPPQVRFGVGVEDPQFGEIVIEGIKVTKIRDAP